MTVSSESEAKLNVRMSRGANNLPTPQSSPLKPKTVPKPHPLVTDPFAGEEAVQLGILRSLVSDYGGIQLLFQVLGDSEKETPKAFTAQTKAILECLPRKCIVLVGPRGTGKTLTVTQIASVEFSLFFDCSLDESLLLLQKQLDSLSPGAVSHESVAASLLEKVILSRFVVFELLLSHHPLLTALDWLAFQQTSRAQYIFGLLFSKLLVLSHQQANQLLCRIVRRLGISFPQCLVFNRSHLLLQSLLVRYQPSQDASPDLFKFEKQMESHFSLLSHILSQTHFRVLWSGNHSALESVLDYYSESNSVLIHKHDIFDANQVKSLIETKLKASLDPCLISEMSWFLTGRLLFVDGFLDDISSLEKGHCTSKDILLKYNQFVSGLVSPSTDCFSFYDAWNERCDLTINFHHQSNDRTLYTSTLIKMLAYYIGGISCATQVDPNADLLSSGLVLCDVSSNDLSHVCIAEPIVASAGLLYLRDIEDEAFHDCLLDCLSVSKKEDEFLCLLVLALVRRFMQEWYNSSRVSHLVPQISSSAPIGVIPPNQLASSNYLTRLIRVRLVEDSYQISYDKIGLCVGRRSRGCKVHLSLLPPDQQRLLSVAFLTTQQADNDIDSILGRFLLSEKLVSFLAN